MQNPEPISTVSSPLKEESEKYKLPKPGNLRAPSSLMYFDKRSAHLIFCTVSIVGHLSCNGTPGTCFMMIYGVPMPFSGSPLQSTTSGTGKEVKERTSK